MWEATSCAPSLPSPTPSQFRLLVYLLSFSNPSPPLHRYSFALAQSLIVSLCATSQLPSGTPGPLHGCGAVWLKQVSD